MKVNRLDPPRRFTVGSDQHIAITHSANIELQIDEQVTFIDEELTEHDLVRKSWGYYASSSLNHRLPAHGLLPVLVKNRSNRLYLLLVKRGSEAEFYEYLETEGQEVVSWLHGDP